MKHAMENKKKMSWTMMLAVCTALATALAGCSGSSAGTTNPTEEKPNDAAAPADATTPAAPGDAEPELEPVELTWYYPQNQAHIDQAVVNEAVNKITKEKINATIKLMPIDFGTYEQKLNTIVASNEAIDIIWTSGWLFSFANNQRKGVFQPLDDLLKEHGQKLYDSMEEKFWNDAKIDGQIYAVPNYQISANRAGLVLQKRFVDKYNLDLSTIKKIDDIEPFLKQIKENEPGIVPFGTTRGFYTPFIYGIDAKVRVYKNDPTHTVLPEVTKEMRENFKLVHSWYSQGLINEDAATLKSAADAYNKGNTAVWFDFTGKPGSEVEFSAAIGGEEVVLHPLAKAVFTGAGSTMNAISRTSKNPERAMMFLELVNTDKELYNTLVYGIEGKHYEKTTGNFIKTNPESGYFTNTDWVFGNIRNEYLPEGAPADKLEQTAAINAEAEVSPYNGFVFNTDPVKTETANVKAVNDEYYAALASGTLDPEEYLPIYEEKLEKAGTEVIRAETQKQLNEWLAANGKK